jgi:general secretion pathway protein L
MAGTLYLRLEQHGASWIVRGPDAFRRMEQGSLETAAVHAPGNRVVVIVPATEVLITEANVPTKQGRRLRQAVPYAIEEQLSDEVERLHFSIGSKRTESGVPVAVVSRARMAEWNEGLDGVGIHPNAFLPETLAVPLGEGEWSLLLDPSGVVLRTGEYRGFALADEGLDTLLALAFEQAGEARPKNLRVFDCRGDGLIHHVHAACAAAQVEVTEEACSEGPLRVLADGLMKAGATIDLLQGDFSRREQLGKFWRPWQPAAVLLGIWLLLQGLIGGYQYVTLTGESRRLDARIEEIYRQAFPEARNVSNPRMQMEQHLKELRGGSGSVFAELMGKTGPVFLDGSGLELIALRYKDRVLDADVTASDFQALDKIKQQLASQGLNVELQNAAARGGKTEGHLRIREGSK